MKTVARMSHVATNGSPGCRCVCGVYELSRPWREGRDHADTPCHDIIPETPGPVQRAMTAGPPRQRPFVP